MAKLFGTLRRRLPRSKLAICPGVLGFVVSLLCVAAAGAAGGIVFVLFGPVRRNRSRPVPLLSASHPLPTAARPVAMPGMAVFDPVQAAFTPARPLPVA